MISGLKQQFFDKFQLENRGKLITDHVLLFGSVGLCFLNKRAGPAFKVFTNKRPFISSAAKFMVLGTYGELLAHRIKNGEWDFTSAPQTALYWSLAGPVIKFAFGTYFGGVAAMGSQGVFRLMNNRIAHAISSSVLLNITFYPFLVKFHKSFNKAFGKEDLTHSSGEEIVERTKNFGKDIGTLEFLKAPADWVGMAKFWIGFHCITPLLPPHLQMLYAAAGGPLLGLDMAFKESGVDVGAKIAGLWQK
eukprot:TRINITY_DN774146_c0_g1_i1.p1 TRINITY_DN774146_c0_g1~~TRINITY_DN774146_c0_g1_i1.p1  ORF type:complete len:248 (+),score=57.03 TRINITY_DN774146_c0_g1_i1:70-813(+)